MMSVILLSSRQASSASISGSMASKVAAPSCTWSFTLTGSEAMLDYWPQPPTQQWQTSDYFVGGFGSTYNNSLIMNGNYGP